MKVHNILIIALLIQLNAFSQDLIRGPYLQSLTNNSVKVMWRTTDATIGQIDVSLSPDGTDAFTLTDTSAVEDHILLVNGLAPGVTYYYRISTQDNALTDWDEMYRFKTIPEETNSLSFWATGDFGAKSQKQIDVKNAMINHVDGDYPDFWLWLGDNAYDDGTDLEFQERVFAAPYGYYDLLPFLPFFPVPGNHDYHSVNAGAPPPAHKGPYFDIVEVPINGESGGIASGTELYYSYDYGNAHFIAINSEAFAYTFFSQSVMEDWLREDLAASDKMWNIAYWHQPPYSKGTHDSDDFWEIFMKAMRKNYNPIIENAGVDLVLGGHSHVYERSGLIKGHYGGSASFNESMEIDMEEPFEKYLDGENPNEGTMYIVVGNSGKTTSEPSAASGGTHPAFVATDYGSEAVGSILVNIEDNVLNGKYIRGDGTVADEFNIIKSLQDSSVVTNVIDNLIDDFVVYPNPTKDVLNIQFNVKKNTPISFTIYDEAGKQYVNEAPTNYSIGSHTKTIKLSEYDLPSGNYMLKIGGGEESDAFKLEKIVKVE